MNLIQKLGAAQPSRSKHIRTYLYMHVYLRHTYATRNQCIYAKIEMDLNLLIE